MTEAKREWKVVDEVNGPVQAEIIRGMLKARGIQVDIIQEGAGRALGLEVAPLGIVQVLVPAGNYDEAKAILEAYYRDELEG